MPQCGARDEAARLCRPQEVHLEVGRHGRLAFLGVGEGDRSQRLVRDGRDRSAVNDRAARCRKPVRLGRHVGLEHELAVGDLDDPGPDVGHHSGRRPFFVELRQRCNAVVKLLPIHEDVPAKPSERLAPSPRCSSMIAETSL